MASPDRARFVLDPEVTFLNHGSFGACPRAVLEAQSELRARLEREPVRFFVHELPALLDAAREEVAAFVGAAPEDLVFVRNATQGVAAVLASLALEEGDELLTTSHAYGACRNALERAAARTGAKVVVADVPFPLRDPSEVLDAIDARVGPRTVLALIDHVTSPTGLVFPLAAIVERLEGRGVHVLVDGAHGPGMVPLALGELGASYYTGNLHKWVCAPKGAGLLHVRRDRQAHLHPAVTSHGMKSQRARPMLWEEFDWVGTDDPTPWLSVPAALRELASMRPGGWAEVMASNRRTALAARDALCATLGIDAPAPDAMIGALAAVPLPRGEGPPPTSSWDVDPLWHALETRHRIQIPVFSWPAPPHRLLRIACPVYVDGADVQRLAEALRAELPMGR
jgi:isopenicillin-N epimerase